MKDIKCSRNCKVIQILKELYNGTNGVQKYSSIPNCLLLFRWPRTKWDIEQLETPKLCLNIKLVGVG